MLPLPNLNQQDINEALEQSLLKIKNSNWDDTAVHDPGLTLLEIFTYLHMKQRKDIDKIGERSLQKYLKLLQIPKVHVKPATTEVGVFGKDDVFVPPYLKMKSFGCVFETVESQVVGDNEILFLQNTIDHIQRQRIVGKEEHPVAVFSKEALVFYIGLSCGIPEGKFSLYSTVQKNGKRNSIGVDDDFVELSLLQWEFYGTKDGITTWHKLEVLEDETHNFLFSGKTKFNLEGKMEATTLAERDCYLLRACCQEFGYEATPKIYHMVLDSVSVVQKNTLCHKVSFTYKAFLENDMQFASAMADQNCLDLFIKQGDAFQLAEDMEVLYLIKETMSAKFRLGTSKRQELLEQFAGLAEDDVVLELVVYDPSFVPHKILGFGDGTANKEYILPVKGNVLAEDFAIMIKSPKGWQQWEQIDTLDACKGEELCYILEEKNRAIGFGDNYNGKIPSLGVDNIRVVSLSMTEGNAGNRQRFTIHEILDDRFQDVKILHYQDVKSGKDVPSAKELLNLVRKSVEEVQRAVTLEDYRELVYGTPGLSLGAVSVIPLFQKGLLDYPNNKVENVVTIVVEPYCFTTNPKTLEKYVENVKKHMELYRMLTTKIYVDTPKYVELKIYGEVRIQNGRQMKMKEYSCLIHETLASHLHGLQEKNLGVTIGYGDLQNIVEQLDFVEEVKYLQLDLQLDGISKNDFGDIKVPPNVKVYMEQNHIILS